LTSFNTAAGTFAWVPAGTTPVGNAGSRTHNVRYTPNDADNYNTLTQSVTITVNKINPTPTWPSGLTANYEQTLSAISLTSFNTAAGTFAWVPAGTTPVGNAGSRTHDVRYTPTDSDNYNTLTQSVTITVARITGAMVSTFTLAPPEPDEIIINAAALTGNSEQNVIQYIVSTSSTPPVVDAAGWATAPEITLPFGSSVNITTGISQGTQYYIYARAKQSTNYLAGAIRSEPIRTSTQSNITITFTPNADIALSTTPGDIVISISGNTQRTFTLEGASFNSIQWYVNGTLITGATGSSYTLRGQDFNQFTPVQSQLYVEVVRGGITYNLSIPFRVNP